MKRERVEAVARACERNASRMSRTELDRWYRANVGFRLTEDVFRRKTQDMRAAVASSMFYKKMPAGVDTEWAEVAEREMSQRILAEHAKSELQKPAVMSATQVAAWASAVPPRRGSRSPRGARQRGR